MNQQRDFLKWLEDDAPLPPSLSGPTTLPASLPQPPEASTNGGAAQKAPSPSPHDSPLGEQGMWGH